MYKGDAAEKSCAVQSPPFRVLSSPTPSIESLLRGTYWHMPCTMCIFRNRYGRDSLQPQWRPPRRLFGKFYSLCSRRGSSLLQPCLYPLNCIEPVPCFSQALFQSISLDKRRHICRRRCISARQLWLRRRQFLFIYSKFV